MLPSQLAITGYCCSHNWQSLDIVALTIGNQKDWKHLDIHVRRLVGQVEEEGFLGRVAFDHLHSLPDRSFHHKSPSPYIYKYFYVPGVEVCGELALSLKAWLCALMEVVGRLQLTLGVVVLHCTGVVISHLSNNDQTCPVISKGPLPPAKQS